MLRALSAHYGAIAGHGRAERTRTLRSSDADRKEPLVLSAGRLWDEAKNVDGARASRRACPGRVALAGEARPTWPASGASTMRSSTSGGCRRPSCAAWMARAAIYALPARYEPFGLSMLEAALSGCALVLGDIPSLREIWDGAAVFVAPDDHDALRAAIQRLIDAPGTARGTGAGARARAAASSPSSGWSTATSACTTACSRPSRARHGGLVVRVVIFCHSLLSDWNHGNAHFLRGVASELVGARPRRARLRAARRVERRRT